MYDGADISEDGRLPILLPATSPVTAVPVTAVIYLYLIHADIVAGVAADDIAGTACYWLW